MPKKSHRVAAKEAELRHKKRRGRPNVYVPPVGVPSTATEETATQAQIVSPVETETFAPAPRSERATSRAPVATTARGRAIASSLSSYTYLAKELRRIAMVTGIISAILVGLTFVLR